VTPRACHSPPVTNILKTTEFYTLKVMNYISIKTILNREREKEGDDGSRDKMVMG
jgi:hypothetical protein